MTKLRPPLTAEDALARIAGQIPGGYEAMGAICGRGGRQVRKWGDPDQADDIPFGCAVKLDTAYQEHGGNGAPLHDTYALQLELAVAERFGEQHELARHSVHVAREAGEAVTAVIEASLPGADPSTWRAALKEGEEAVTALKSGMATIQRMLKGQEAPP